jgi:hypothetical protein
MIYMKNYNNKDMKKILLFLSIVFLVPSLKSEGQTNLEKLNNYKIGFFTKKLDLSSEEAVKFWPVYNEYQTQRNSLQMEKLKINRNFNQNESSLSDKQLTEMGDKYVDLLAQESNLAVDFHKKLKEVLPPAKVIRYYQAENQYKAQLLNELQNVKQEQRIRPARRFNN